MAIISNTNLWRKSLSKSELALINSDRIFFMHLEAILIKYNLTVKDLQILKSLCEELAYNSEVSQGTLAILAQENVSTLQRKLNNLRKTGFIVMVDSVTDGRQVLIYPKSKALNIYNEYLDLRIKLLRKNGLDFLNTEIDS